MRKQIMNNLFNKFPKKIKFKLILSMKSKLKLIKFQLWNGYIKDRLFYLYIIKNKFKIRDRLLLLSRKGLIIDFVIKFL